MALLAEAGRGNRVWKGPEMPAGLCHVTEFGGILGVRVAEWLGLEDGMEAVMAKALAGYGCWGDGTAEQVPSHQG